MRRPGWCSAFSGCALLARAEAHARRGLHQLKRIDSRNLAVRPKEVVRYVHDEAEIPFHLPSPADALPGRATADSRPRRPHFVNGAPLKGPYPEGSEGAMFGLGCFWGAEKAFWSVPGVIVTAVGYAGGARPIRPMRKSAAAAPATTRRCLSSSIRSASAMASCLKLFFEGHDPTQGMRQGNDFGTQYRSGIYVYVRRASAAQAEAAKRALRPGARAQGFAARHDGDFAGRPSSTSPRIITSNISPKSARLLRARRHWRVLPDRHRR